MNGNGLMLDNLIVVEYSCSQRCFHISSLFDVLFLNRTIISNVVKGKQEGTDDFLPVAVATSEEEADSFVKNQRAF